MFRCVHCQQDINVGASICPFCHFSPIFPGQGPYDGGTVPFNAMNNGPGLFTSLRNLIFGDPNVPRLNKVRSNETTGDVVMYPPGSANPAARRICAKCKSANWPTAPKCERCKRTFVEEYV